MPLTIEIPDELAILIEAKAAAEGLSPDRYVGRVLERTLSHQGPDLTPKPLKSGRGMWAKYGPAPSAEEIDENRRDMLRGSVFET